MVLNPITGRKIRVNSPTFQLLVRRGILPPRCRSTKRRSTKRRSTKRRSTKRRSTKRKSRRLSYNSRINRRRGLRNQTRPSSASTTRVGTLMRGNDGRIYQVRHRSNGSNFWKKIPSGFNRFIN
jgi:hypothetical protein